MSDMKQKTKVGMAWNTFEKVSVQGSAFVIAIILAKLLDPSDYGLVGMVNIFVAFTTVFIDSGFSRALIQKQDRTEQDYTTALIFNFATGVILYAIMFFCAPAIARFYKAPELVPIARVFFISLIFSSLSVVQIAKFSVKVDFRSIAIVNALSTILGGVFGIILAYNGFGTWSLVYQNLARTGIATILYWILGRWKPVTGFSFASFKALFGFGSKVMVSGLLETGVNNINSLLIGRVYSTEGLGFYTKAQQFPELTVGTMNGVLNSSTFPLLSSLQDKKDELVAVFRKLIRLSAFIVYPAIIGLTVLAKPIIVTLIGEKWLPSVTLMQYLSLSFIFFLFNNLNLNLYNAIGRSDLYLKVDLIKLPFILITLFITIRISTLAIAIGQAITAVLYFIISAWMTGRMFGFGPFRQFLCTWKYLIAALLMGVVVYFVDQAVISNLWSLILGLLAGVVSYAVFILIMRDDIALSFLRKIFPNKK